MPIDWRATFGDDPENEIPGQRIRYATRWPDAVHRHAPSEDQRHRRPDRRAVATDFLRGKRRD